MSEGVEPCAASLTFITGHGLSVGDVDRSGLVAAQHGVDHDHVMAAGQEVPPPQQAPMNLHQANPRREHGLLRFLVLEPAHHVDADPVIAPERIAQPQNRDHRWLQGRSSGNARAIRGLSGTRPSRLTHSR